MEGARASGGFFRFIPRSLDSVPAPFAPQKEKDEQKTKRRHRYTLIHKACTISRYRYTLIHKERIMAARKDEFGMTPFSQVRAQAKYDKENTQGFHMKLNVRTDIDIIRWLWRQPSKQGSIKRLIREEIARAESNPSQSE